MPRRRTVSASSATNRSPKRPRVENNVTESRSTRDALLGGSDSVGRFHLRSDEDFVATARVLKNVEDSGSELRPRSVSLLPKENGHAHHTEEYDCSELVLRRGQDFDMSITFDRKFNPETDQLTLQLTTGSRPIESKGTVIRIDVADTIDRMTMNWQAKFADDEVEGDTLNLLVWSPCDAIVGRYRLFLETRCQDGDSIWCSRKEMPDSFLLVFNPWCKADSVFLEEEELRAEYVLNETGRIWQGSARSHHGQPWNFGQFESVCINAALYLLDKAELSDGARSNTVLVVRTLSQMSNSNDADGGVLTGRWTDAYPKTSTVPWAWSGSVAILEEFMKTKKAVCYGQCWVFSGLVTTLCRALGIPTRSVTNFESAHDCDGSVTIDYHWNEKDKPIVDENDSVWNFHVWNESWMRRTDLPDGYDGWQAHDATPQEASEGVMKCGPAPVQAIKDGNVYLPYDSKFIFAEVNGDKVHWLVKDNGCMSVLNVDMRSVGINMSTKSVGSTLREDITENYKFPEGSPEERKAVYRAFRHSSRRELPVYNVDPPDVLFELDCPDQVTLGEDFEIKVDLKNEIAEDRTVHIQLTAIASFYTGVTSKSVGTQEFDELVPAKETKTITLPVKHAVYQKFLQPESLVTVFVKGTVKETERSFARIDTIRLNKPEIALMHPEKVTINEEFEVHIKFTNPLDEKLTNGCFHIEGHGFTTPRMVLYKKVIGPGESVSHTINLSAHRSGTRELIVNFSSDQLVGLTGSAEVYVSYGG